MPKPIALVPRHPASSAEAHEEVFVRAYAALYALARRLAGGDADLAGDLVQDAYVQFVVTRPDLTSIARVDAYLAVLLRNISISRGRRAASRRDRHLPLEEYDSAESALRAAEPEQRLIARDTLARIYAHVIDLKDRSRPASILALRFFHGLYPSDISRIVRTTPAAIHEWLRQARHDVRRTLESSTPARRRAITTPAWRSAGDRDDPTSVVSALRQALFTTSQPPCASRRDIRGWYARGAETTSAPLDAATLSHVAGCPRCFDLVCAAAGLPPIDDERDGPSGDRRRSGPRAPAAPGLRGGAKRVRDLLEHRPRQLLVSINGHQVGVVRVESARTELQWTVRLDEPVAFAELHSEQGLRMALLHVDLPPDGSLVQSVRVGLSDDRVLQLALDFSGVHPAVAVTYVDPALTPSAAAEQPRERDGDPLHGAPRTSVDATAGEAIATAGRSWWTRLRDVGRRVPRLVPVTGSVVLAAALVWLATRQSPEPSPRDLIEQAVSHEVAAVPASGAVHRTLRFEVRAAGTDAAVMAHRIESWVRADTQARAVRVFDRANHLIAGRWTVDGRDQSVALGVLDDVWAAELSAATFRDRYLALGSCATRADAGLITLTCTRPTATGLLDRLTPIVHAQAVPTATAVSRAAIVLRRPDLHAVRLILTVRPAAAPATPATATRPDTSPASAEHIVTLAEQELVHVPIAEVPADAFTPESRPVAAAAPARTAVPPRRVTPATPSLEIRVLELVDQLAAGEYLSVDRAGATGLALSGLVSTAGQKRALLAAVSGLDAAGAVTTDVRTFEEAARHDAPAGRAPARGTRRVRRFESGLTTAPIDAYMRTRAGHGRDAIALVREMTPRVLASSERLRRHAVALRTLVDRFDDRAVGAFDEAGTRAWRTLLGRHLAACLDMLAALDASLEPYFDLETPPAARAPDTLRVVTHRLGHEANTINEVLTRGFVAAATSAAPAATGESPASAEAAATGASARAESKLAHASSGLDVRQHIHRAQLDARFLQQLVSP